MWVRRAQADAGQRSDVLSSVERDRLRLLERENRELRRQNETSGRRARFIPSGSERSRAATNPAFPGNLPAVRAASENQLF